MTAAGLPFKYVMSLDMVRFNEMHGAEIRRRRENLIEEALSINVAVWGDKKAWKQLRQDFDLDESPVEADSSQWQEGVKGMGALIAGLKNG